MKKLMTMVGAAMMAFGLFAADPVVALHGASMETDEGYTVGEGVVGVDSNWVTDAEADESVVTAYGEETAPDHLNYDCFWMGQENYLKVEAEQPLYRAIAAATGTKTENLVPADIAVEGERDGIIIDQLVKFSAFDAESAPAIEEGAKIAVWVKAGEEDDTTGTFQITTAELDAETFEPTTTTIDTEIEVAVADWHQLKITAIKAADVDGDAVPGFIVELNGEVIAKAEGLFPEVDDIYTQQAKELIAQNKLFPSMVVYGSTGADTLVGVAYKGTGAIDDVAAANYTAEAPATTTIDVELAEGVTATVVPGTFDNENGTWTFPAGTATGTITLTAPQGKLFKSNGKDTLVIENVDLTNGDLDYSDEEVDDAVAQIGTVLYLTLNEALEAAEADDEVGLLKSIVLDDTLVIDKAITFEMNGKEITLAADKAIGVDVKAAATIQDGGFISTRETYANNAYAILNEAVNAAYSNLTIIASNYKFGLTCDSPAQTDADMKEECETPPTVTVNCWNVDIIGNGTLFYAQHTILNLDEDCSAIKDKNTSGGYAAAVYSALNSTVTIAGGYYEHDYALISGNLGGAINVDGGEFKGAIKSYMKVGAHPELEDIPGYKAQFLFNGGTYDGEIVFEDENARELDFFKKDDEVTTLAAPAGYKWDEDGVLVKDVEPETYDITITAPENGTLETSVTNDVEVGTTVTVTATPAEGYELESITTNDVALAEGETTFEMPAEDVTVAATFKQVSYPPEWPEADPEVAAKFAEWSAGPGKGADLSTDAAKNAFLLNVAVDGIKDLKIESIEVDADGYAAIVVAAPGETYFDNIDLAEINGVLYVEAGDKIETMQPRAITYWTTTSGKANVTVRYNFIKAAIGFKKPEVDAAEKLPKTEE